MKRQSDLFAWSLFTVILLFGCIVESCLCSVLNPLSTSTRRRRRRASGISSNHPERISGRSVVPRCLQATASNQQIHQQTRQTLSSALLLAARPTTSTMLVGLSATAAFYYLQRDKRRRESPVQRALYFWYRAGPIVVHYRFTQWWLNTVVAANNKQHRDQVYETLHNRYCQPCLDIILQLQGLYCKIGQVLSARPDFIPIQYVELFSTVQDSLPPWPASQVKSRVRQALRSERGLELEDVFERIDEECLGSASIGQVHRAVLKSPFDTQKGYKGGNKVVAIKVMSPGAESRFAHDFKVFKWLCRVALPGWKPLLQELERQMMTEFDYLNEAKSLSEIRTNMLKTKYRKCVQIPQPVTNLCCKHLLVMEMLEGKKLAQSIEDKLAAALGGDKQVAQDFLRRKREGFFLEKEIGIDSFDRDYLGLLNAHAKHSKGRLRRWLSSTRSAIRLLSLYRQTRYYVDLLVDVHGHQIFIDGCYNGDPHPGNCLELSNGKLGLIDYGQTRRLTDAERINLCQIVSQLGKTSIDVASLADAMRQFGFKTRNNKDEVLARYAALFFDNDVEAKRMGCATPQLYLLKLAEMDPLENVPDAAVFVARTSFLFRGMGAMLDEQVHTSKRWCNHADQALSRVTV